MENLSDYNIRLRSQSVGDHKTTCPQCSDTRRNKKDPCLSVTVEPDGGAVWKCHHCEWSGNLKFDEQDRRDYRPVRKTYTKPSVIIGTESNEMIRWFEARGIKRETVEKFNIVQTSTYFGSEKAGAIAFPYYLEGELVNRKYRTRDKRFRQEKDAQRTLFNVDAVKLFWETTEDKTVYFVEGEMDVLTLYQCGITNVVTLPDGAPQSKKFDADDKRFQALQSSDWLSEADKVVIAVDDDEPGKNLEAELVHRFGRHRCWSVAWPKANDVPCKDANETLMTYDAETVIECLEAASPFPVDGLHAAGNYKKEVFDLYHGRYQRPLDTGWDDLDEIYKVMPGTFQLVTGIPNHGKSNWLDQLILNLSQRHGWKFALFSPEHSAGVHLRRMVEKVVKKPFETGVVDRMTERELESGLEYLSERVWFLESKDAVPTIDWILEKAMIAAVRYGINGVVIDPFNTISAERGKSTREDEFIRDLIAKCKLFCQSHNITMWMVAHPHKLQRADGGAYNPPSLYEVAGSAHWNNMADVGLVVHRDFDSNTTKVITRKIREQGLYGQIGEVEFAFDPQTRTYKTPERQSNPGSWMDRLKDD